MHGLVRAGLAAAVLASALTACRHVPATPALPDVFAELGISPREIELVDARVRFLEAGPWQDAAIPIVFVHGVGGSLDDFRPLIVAAAKTDHLYAFDLPGYGHSSNPNFDFRISYYVSVLHAFATALAVPRLHLVCHSLGGQICLAYALEDTQRVATLTLIDAAGLFDPKTYPKSQMRRVARIQIGNTEMRSWLFRPFAGEEQRLVKRLFLRDAAPLSSVAMFKSNLRRRVRDLRVPTLIVWGAKDPVFPVENAFYLKTNVHGSVLRLVDGAGHVPFAHDPERVLRWIRDFQRAPARPRDGAPP